MKKAMLILIFTTLFICSCGGMGGVPMHVLLKNPATGQTVYVSNSVYSTNFGVHLNAVMEQARTIRAYQMMGFTEMQEVR
jgi:hypothetical protein